MNRLAPAPSGQAYALGIIRSLARRAGATTALTGLLVGLPWTLWHFIGWPLPNHVPSWADLERVLAQPMTATFVLDVLACVSWLAWAAFVVDAARFAAGLAHSTRIPDLSAAGPLRRIAAVLVGTVLVSVPAPLAAAGPADNPRAVVTAPTTAADPDLAARGAIGQPARATSAVVLPYVPTTGVHDSLWRMAERTLGDGNRWPEIYALNKGKTQPGGATFTHPGLVFPGEQMTLPDDATMPAAPVTPPAPPQPAPLTPPPTSTPPPSSPATPAPSTTSGPSTTPPPTKPHSSPQTAQAPPSANTPAGPGFSWGEELFVGLGLASAVSTALVIARRRNRRRYRPGSGDRSDLPVAPAVYQLRLAHRRANHNDLDDDLDSDLDGERRRDSEPDHESVNDRAPGLSVGVRDGHEIALDLAATHGLGLLGPGAPAAIRALLLTALTTKPTATPATSVTSVTPATQGGSSTIIVPVEDLAALLGRRAQSTPSPAGLHVAADLDAALDVLESETLVRAGRPLPTGRTWSPVVLVARTPGRQARRLQAVLDNGSTVGVTGLLLGQWPPGVTAYVRDDGTISTTSPGIGEPLRGTRVFRLGEDHTADLLALLRNADHHTGSGHGTTGPSPSAVHSRHEIRGDEDGCSTLADTAHDRPGDRALEILGPVPPSVVSPAPPRMTIAPEPAADNQTADNQPGDQPADDGPRGHDNTGREAPFAPLRISVLGPPQVWWRPTAPDSDNSMVEREITSAFQPRLRELLVFLAVHPDGATREALLALWATSSPANTTNAMNTSLSRIRRALAGATDGVVSDVVLAGEGRYRLDPNLVEVDYWSFAAAVATRRAAANDQQRIEAYRSIVDSYRGPLADGMITDWIETAREAIRRDAVDAVAALARALVAQDPQQTLDLLEIARAFDPHNELVYRDIMRLQERLGQLDTIPRTLTLLTTRLAEIDERPTQHTVDLAERLLGRHDLFADPSRPDLRHGRAG